MAGESHEISEEKHVSRAESIATMPWQKHGVSVLPLHGEGHWGGRPVLEGANENEGERASGIGREPEGERRRRVLTGRKRG